MTPALHFQACLADHWQASMELVLRALVFAGMAGLALWALGKRFFPGKQAFVALCLVTAAWIGAALAEHASASAGCKGAFALASWLAILAQPPLWALFLYQYLNSETRAPSTRLRLLLAAPVLLLAGGVVTNGAHGLFYGPGSALGPVIDGAPRMRYDYGPLFRLGVAHGYAWLLVAAALVVRGHAHAAPALRGQWLAFLFVMGIPVALNAAYLGFGLRLLGGDPTVLGFAASVLGFAWMVRRGRLFDVVPMARRLLFAELPDPVLVLDAQGHVVDANVAAAQLAGRRPPHGTPLAAWPRFGAALAARLAHAQETGPLTLADSEAVFDVRCRQIGEGAQRIGTLVLLHDVTEHRQAHIEVVQTLAERDAELDRAAEEQALLREQALRDPLTGLLNRRALEERYRQEAAHAEQTGLPLALVLVDLDHFKRINDSHGHTVGDAVLRDFAQALRTGLRAGDTTYRLGGEEFALLLPGADAGDAARRIDAFREAIAGRRLGGLEAGVTFSAGVACADGARLLLVELFEAADRALYAAKSRGRNRSEVAANA